MTQGVRNRELHCIMPQTKPLENKVALVAGATRGAGRGIARALGEAGATVYCTGRSVKGNPSPYNRPETIDETAEMIESKGGKAIAVRVDHTVEAEVEALVTRIKKEQENLDIVVNAIAGEDPMMAQWASFWECDMSNADKIFRQSILSHILTAKHAAKVMIEQRKGLIVEVTESDTLFAGGNPMSQLTKFSLKAFAQIWATELRPHKVAAIAITPGFLRSETMLQHFGVTEQNWREAGKQDKNFLESETPLFVGRAVAALAADPAVMDATGQLASSWELSRKYGFTDEDGRRPDWGALKIDYSQLPGSMIDMFRDGTELQLEWLNALLLRTKRFGESLG